MEAVVVSYEPDGLVRTVTNSTHPTLTIYLDSFLVWAGASTLARREFYLPQPMNLLVVGSQSTETILDQLEHLPEPFLLVHDETDVKLPKRRKVTHFDVAKHSFNLMKGMNYVRSLEFLSAINALFPEGQNTLTKRYADFALLEALNSNPKDLSRLFPRADKKDVGLTDAAMKIDRLLMSPVLSNVLLNPTNFSFSGIILARLNRAELGDDDCFALANLLISHYKGTVVLPDFGFYGCSFHTCLIRQNRLIAGVNFLDEAPTLRNQLLLIEDKIAAHCTEEDAVTLAPYLGWHSRRTGYNEFIQSLIE